MKSLTYHKTTPVKKRKVAEGLWAQDDTDDHDREGGTDMSSYFQRMKIYFTNAYRRVPMRPEESWA